MRESAGGAVGAGGADSGAVVGSDIVFMVKRKFRCGEAGGVQVAGARKTRRRGVEDPNAPIGR